MRSKNTFDYLIDVSTKHDIKETKWYIYVLNDKDMPFIYSGQYCSMDDAPFGFNNLEAAKTASRLWKKHCLEIFEKYYKGKELTDTKAIEFCKYLNTVINNEIKIRKISTNTKTIIDFKEEEDNMGVISSTGEIEPEKYEAQEIPIKDIEKMMKNGTWEGSLEEEEVKYNIDNYYYPEKYSKKLKKLINYYEKMNKNEN